MYVAESFREVPTEESRPADSRLFVVNLSRVRVGVGGEVAVVEQRGGGHKTETWGCVVAPEPLV